MAANMWFRVGRMRRWWFLALACLFFCLTVILLSIHYSNLSTAVADAEEPPANGQGPFAVTAGPLKTATFDRIADQPGSVLAFNEIKLYAGVSGYLKKQFVDYGDTVKEGQVLAVLDVPVVEKQVAHHRAILEQANARVKQLQAKVSSARADVEAAKAAVTQAEASAKSAKATLHYRELKLDRIMKLFKSESIQEAFVDEAQAQYDAAIETELSAKAAIVTAKSKVIARASKVEGAEADVLEAEAEVKVAQADLEKSQVQLDFATIKSPFNGVITKRNFDVGAFIRDGATAGDTAPLFTIAKIDTLRVVVQLADEYVPYANKGDTAYIQIDAFRGQRDGQKIEATISRMAQAEDPNTRYMRVEIDLPNPDLKFVPGMYGRVSIILEHITHHLALPTDCLVGKTKGGVGRVFVVRNGRAKLVAVRLGLNNGGEREVLDGLGPKDRVIRHPPPGLTDGAAVIETELAEAQPS